MTVYVFLGPTLAVAEARAHWDVEYLPPVRQGDVYRTALQRPEMIGIVDGYFEGMPAVWHKEILWAMAQGIPVFGAASMGALRAAELAPFGMQGVGLIFAAYRDGLLEDDDEVAVVHGPPELGYRPVTEALVNMRATFTSAVEAGVIDAVDRSRLETAAKGLFYQHRSYAEVLRLAVQQDVLPETLAPLEDWLRDHRVDQKRLDALAMLNAMQEWRTAGRGPLQVAYHFERTEVWDNATAAVADGGPTQGADELNRILDEARLVGRYAELRRAALLYALAAGAPPAVTPDQDALRAARDALRRKHSLWTHADLARWLRENDLDSAGFDRLVADEARVALLERLHEPKLIAQMGHVLRSRGDYNRFAMRARHKQMILEKEGKAAAEPGDTGTAMLGIMTWYCEQRLGRALPDDYAAFAGELGFTNLPACQRALLREYWYCQTNAAQALDEV